TEPDLRGVNQGVECTFPSWTSWVRIPSPALPRPAPEPDAGLAFWPGTAPFLARHARRHACRARRPLLGPFRRAGLPLGAGAVGAAPAALRPSGRAIKGDRRRPELEERRRKAQPAGPDACSGHQVQSSSIVQNNNDSTLA